MSDAALAPPDEAALAADIAAAAAAGEPLAIAGNGTKRAMLRPVQAARGLSTANLRGITLYAPKELVLRARAGTPLPEIEAALAAEGQHLIAEPPDPAALFGAAPPATSTPATLGGIVAANLSGPRRVAWGAMRDHVLGLRAVNGSGEVLRSGGRVLKNVTGLDLCKLLTGSHGTLAVITEITLKVLPAPEAVGTVALPGLDAAHGVAALAAALGSPYGVSAAAYLPAEAAARVGFAHAVALARIEEFAPSVAYRTDRLRDRPRFVRRRRDSGRCRFPPSVAGGARRRAAAGRGGGRGLAGLGAPLGRACRAGRACPGGAARVPGLGRRPRLARRAGHRGDARRGLRGGNRAGRHLDPVPQPRAARRRGRGDPAGSAAARGHRAAGEGRVRSARHPQSRPALSGVVSGMSRIPTYFVVPPLLAAFVVLTYLQWRSNAENYLLNIRFLMASGAILLMFVTRSYLGGFFPIVSFACFPLAVIWLVVALLSAAPVRDRAPGPWADPMQTNFTAEQLRDPGHRRLQPGAAHLRALRLLHRDLPDLPAARRRTRQPARPHLPDQGHAGDPAGPATEDVVRHVDRCLSCLSCMTTCPSGVHYMHLVDHARTHIERTYRRPWHDRLLRAVLAAVLPRPRLFRAAWRRRGSARPFAGLLPATASAGAAAARDAGAGAGAAAAGGWHRARRPCGRGHAQARASRCSPAARSRCWRRRSTPPRSAC